jgi:hypothetical protein
MRWFSPLIVALFLLVGCSGRVREADPELAALAVPAAREVPCVDDQVAQLPLFDEPATGAIAPIDAAEGVFVSAIDATAGGLGANHGFVYARFGERGLEKLVIDDESAFESSAWHIAFRRYVIRLNSGVGGPSSVRASRTAPGTDFDGLVSVPAGLPFDVERYYTDECQFVSDDSGIGSPATLLSSFWSYAACLSMTGNVFVLQLPDGRHLKLQVVAYYTLENQRRCDEVGSTVTPSGAGNIRVRWAYLD